MTFRSDVPRGTTAQYPIVSDAGVPRWDTPPRQGDENQSSWSQTSSDRTFQAGPTALGTVLPAVFGTRKVSGTIAAVYEDAGTLAVAFWLCFGPVDSIATIELGGVDISTLGWVIHYETKLGTMAQTISTYLDNNMPAIFVERWPGIAYVAVIINAADPTAVPNLTLTAVVTRIAAVTDFRGGALASANPVCYAYEVLTAGEPFLNLPAACIDTTSWTTAANSRDTVITDGARYRCNLVTTERDPWQLVKNLLDGCFVNLVAYQDKLYLWADDVDATDSGVKVDAIDLLAPPQWTESPPEQQWPDCVRVKFNPDGATEDNAHVDAEITAGLSSTTLRRTEVTLSGCTSYGEAARYADTELNRPRGQWLVLEVTADRVAANLLPGDVFNLRPYVGAAYMSVRLQRIEDNRDGTYKLRVTAYSTGHHSVATLSGITITPVRVGTATKQQKVHTDTNQHIMEGEVDGHAVNGTWFNLASFTLPGRGAYTQNGDGGWLTLESEVTDQAADKAQHVTASWRWDAARVIASMTFVINQEGTQHVADPGAGTLVLDARYSGAYLQGKVTSSLSGGAPYGRLTWRVTYGGRATIIPA